MNGLKIAWLSPWNGLSAIAHSAAEVAFELENEGHEVTVFRTEVGASLELPDLPAPREVHRLAHWQAHDLNRNFDLAVAQIGDNFNFHGALLAKIEEIPVVGVFHDAFLANLANGWLRESEEELRALVAETYDHEAWPVGEPFLAELDVVMKRRPMLEWLAKRTVAAVAHSAHDAPRQREACPGPVIVLPLPFTYNGLPPLPPEWNMLMVGTIGHANANKRVDQIILAIAASALLRTRCRIKVIGSVLESEKQRLETLSRNLGIPPPHFTGWVTDEALLFELRAVDVIACLRNPILEGASASLVLAMCSQRPTLVTNHGCYAEVPDALLLKCSPDTEAKDAMLHLENVLKRRSDAVSMGNRARDYAVRHHSPKSYCSGLSPLLRVIAARTPLEITVKQVGATLQSFGLQINDPARSRVRVLLDNLLPPQNIEFIEAGG